MLLVYEECSQKHIKKLDLSIELLVYDRITRPPPPSKFP